MSSATIDVGIDLGTSNSSVAVARDGRIGVLRNNLNDQITPSAVRVLKNGSIQVGRKAYEHFRLSEDGSAFARFKRKMGLQVPMIASNTGREFTPEQLAGEVLKSLRGDAERFIGEPVNAAIITVPAMFELVQCEATQRAAAFAGIEEAPLLQEPIAAGLAYGYERDLHDEYFLVYDLGGGTFDVTLMQVAAGRLSVVGTDGDNYLGGGDWDNRLTGVISQRLLDEGYSLWGADDPDGKEFRLRLNLFAEQEKIRLSQEDTIEMVLDGELSDFYGDPIETAIQLSRAEYEQLIVADVERSINVVRRLLDHHKLPSDAVSSMVFVGGPTLTPLVRRMVPSLTGIKAEYSIDPMTVVAHGAALFAATQERKNRRVATSGSAPMARLSLSYQSATDDEIAHVGGRVEDTATVGWSVEIERADGGWSSGRIPLQAGAFFTTVSLLKKRPNTFKLTCFAEQGQAVVVTPMDFTISQGLMLAEPPLARSVGIAVLSSDEKTEFEALVVKGAPLPAVGRTGKVVSARAVNPGDSTMALDIEVFEGDYARPSLNRHVGRLTIGGNDVNRPIPKGTPIELTIRVEKSRTVSVSAYVPLIDETFEGILTNKILLPEDPALTKAMVENDLDRVQQFRSFSGEEVERLEAFAASIDDDLDAAFGGDADRAARAVRQAKELAARIDELEKALQGEIKARDLQWAMQWANQAIARFGTKEERQQLDQFREQSSKAIASSDVAEMEHLTNETYRLYWDVVWNQLPHWIDEFIRVGERVKNAGVSVPVELMDEGRTAIEQQNVEQVRACCQRLMKLLPVSAATFDDQLAMRVGLRRA